jgi:DNA-binding transcriptional MerR regulator
MNYRHIGEHLLSIADFAELVGMTIHALRLYDNTGVFLPARYSKEGCETKTKHRYYSPTQITTIKLIRVLSEIGVPLNAIKELSDQRTPESMMKLLSKHRDLSEDNLRFLQETHSIIDTFIELLNEGMRITETEFAITEMSERSLILGELNDFSDSVGFFREYTRFCSEPHIPKLNLSYLIGGFFDSMDIFLDEPSHPTRFFSLDPKGFQVKAAGLYLIGYTRGYYGHTNDLPGRFAEYAKKNGLVFKGPVYNIYLFDELSIMNQEQYLLQISASVIETRRVASRRSPLKF